VTQYTAVGAVIAIGGSFLLVDDHGAGGVAAAQFAALLISTVPFALLVSRGLLATPMKVLMSSMLRPAAAVACATGFFLAANALTSGFAAAVVAGVLVTALYVVLVFRFVTDDRERNALRGVIRRGSDG
jgi:O-antigen/teichoic acid export membrane protein